MVGFGHNLVNVLLLPGIPIACVGLVGAALDAGGSRRSACCSCSPLATFAVTTLAFPVQTTWGTFLHAAVPPLVLLLVASAAALDAGSRPSVGAARWTRPVAWLGPLFAGFAALLFMSAGIPSYGPGAATSRPVRGPGGTLRGARRPARSRPSR